MFILPFDVIKEVNIFLLLREIVYFYLSNKSFYTTFKDNKHLSDIKHTLHSNSILLSTPYNYSLYRKELFSKYFYKNIPRDITTISDYIRWIYVFKKCILNYNISFFQHDIILFTSRKECNIFRVYKNILLDIKQKSNNKQSNGLNILAKERDLNSSSKNWYHQLEYHQLCNLAYEIMETL